MIVCSESNLEDNPPEMRSPRQDGKLPLYGWR